MFKIFPQKHSAKSEILPSNVGIQVPAVTANTAKNSAQPPLKKIESKSQSFSLKQDHSLKAQVLDANANGETRQKALYELTQLETATAALDLAEIAESDVPQFPNLHDPHSSGAYKYQTELALRVTALEALDQRSVNSLEVSKLIQTVERNQKNPTLKFLAQISLSGLNSQRPGKLHRVIEAMLAEKK